MRYKTAELEGALLDAAVHMALHGAVIVAFEPCRAVSGTGYDGERVEYEADIDLSDAASMQRWGVKFWPNEYGHMTVADWAAKSFMFTYEDGGRRRGLNLDYSTDWSEAGEIIEREKIAIFADSTTGEWGAEMRSAAEHWIDTSVGATDGCGPTPLIAAMRAFVASKLGDDVELPTSAKLAQAPDAEPGTPQPPSPAP